jgi:hypothetical protein
MALAATVLGTDFGRYWAGATEAESVNACGEADEQDCEGCGFHLGSGMIVVEIGMMRRFWISRDMWQFTHFMHMTGYKTLSSSVCELASAET